MRLALVEERVPDAAAAVLGQQHRLGAVEHLVHRHAGLREGRAEFLGVILHRRPGRGADKPRAVEGADEDRVRRVAVGGKVAPFVGRIAVVEVGKGAEHLDPQSRHVIERRAQRLAAQCEDLDTHAETCQSLRL